MVLKIENVSEGPDTVLHLSGRIESEHVQELKAQMDGRTHGIVLDLEQVRLVDLDAAHFLAGLRNEVASSSVIVHSMCGSGFSQKDRGFVNSK